MSKQVETIEEAEVSIQTARQATMLINRGTSR